MSLNIKNERVRELAREAAARTGRDQTSAIELALERLLADLRRETTDSARADLIHSMQRAAELAQIARAAYRDFGRGSGHTAHLNLGDCFAYALASQSGEPLLFIGDDFAATDLTPAWQGDRSFPTLAD